MLDSLANLFTIEGLLHFMLGVVAACAYHVAKARLRKRVITFRWQYLAMPLTVGVVVFTAVQTQQNADCVREFNQVLRDRSSVTSENDQLSIEQRQLIYDWMHNLVFPPPDIADLPGTDERRERWALEITIETDKRFRESLEKQRDNDEYRRAHPLPPPTCGQ